MELEKQVVSLELARKLRELGVKQNSIFAWIDDTDLEFIPTEIRNEQICVAAFTIAELGELLPKEIEIIINEDKDSYGIYTPSLWAGRCEFNEDEKYEWMVCYGNDHTVIDENEANARAKMLIHLLENNLIKLEGAEK